MGRRIVHMSMDVRGALRMSKRQLGRLMRHASGRWATPVEAHDALCDHLAKGHETIPMGAACEGFDFKKGCPGHDVAPGEWSTRSESAGEP